jgi:hypothetical protein
MSNHWMAAAVLAVLGPACWAGDAEADKQTIDGIIQEIELVPTFYAKYPASLKAKPMQKVEAKKLADYAPDQPLQKERDLQQADREKYAKEFPLRAAIFAAAEEMDKAKELQIRMVVFRGVTEVSKAIYMQHQEAHGVALFKLEKMYERMLELDKQRDKEKSKRWRANFDFALTRLETDLIFLMEHNFALGRIRADALPELKPGEDGWRITFKPKINVSEKKAKDLVKLVKKRQDSIKAGHEGTPWAHVAEHESQRSLGMEWTAWAAKKK